VTHDQLTDLTDLIEHFDHRDARLTGATAPDVYAQLRDRGPVARSDRHGGFWILTHYDDVVRALRDHETFSSAAGVFLVRHPGQDPAPPLEFDPPEHTEYRALASDILAPRHLATIEPELRSMVQTLVDDFVASGGGDVMSTLAVHMPLQAVLGLLGIDASKSDRIRALTEQIWEDDIAQKGMDGVRALLALLAEELALRRAEPRDDFLTGLLTKTIGGEPMSDDTILRVTAGLAIAGHETTMNATGYLVHRLASDQSLQQELRAEPERVRGFVEECLRRDAPVHAFFRTVTADVVVGGQLLVPGDRVLLIFAAANRDPDQFAEPDAFLIDRVPNRHLSFGAGIHYCVGAQLARLELRLLTEALLAAPGLRTDEQPVFAPLTAGGHFCGPIRVIVRFTTSSPPGPGAGTP
jgi:cytochrome P450